MSAPIEMLGEPAVAVVGVYVVVTVSLPVALLLGGTPTDMTAVAELFRAAENNKHPTASLTTTTSARQTTPPSPPGASLVLKPWQTGLIAGGVIACVVALAVGVAVAALIRDKQKKNHTVASDKEVTHVEMNGMFRRSKVTQHAARKVKKRGGRPGTVVAEFKGGGGSPNSLSSLSSSPPPSSLSSRSSSSFAVAPSSSSSFSASSSCAVAPLPPRKLSCVTQPPKRLSSVTLLSGGTGVGRRELHSGGSGAAFGPTPGPAAAAVAAVDADAVDADAADAAGTGGPGCGDGAGIVAQQVFGGGIPIVGDNNGFKAEQPAVLQTGNSSALVVNVATRARAAAAEEATQRRWGVGMEMEVARRTVKTRTVKTTSMPTGAAAFSHHSLTWVAQDQVAATAAVQSSMSIDSTVVLFKAKSVTVRPSGVAARKDYREWRKARASRQPGGRSSRGLPRRQHPEQTGS
jgi:hypothetical protein